MKKFLSISMLLVMVFSVSTTAFAGETKETKHNITEKELSELIDKYDLSQAVPVENISSNLIWGNTSICVTRGKVN